MMHWEIVYYSDDLQRLILELPPGLQARYIHLTQRMISFGPDLGMPHTRALGKGLFELRLKAKEGMASILLHSAETAGDDASCLCEEVRQDAS